MLLSLSIIQVISYTKVLPVLLLYSYNNQNWFFSFLDTGDTIILIDCTDKAKKIKGLFALLAWKLGGLVGRFFFFFF